MRHLLPKTRHSLLELTIVVSVQTLEREPQLLLVLLQIPGELAEVQSPVLVSVPGRDDFLQRRDQIELTICITKSRIQDLSVQTCKPGSETPETFDGPWIYVVYLCSTLAENTHCLEARS